MCQSKGASFSVMNGDRRSICCDVHVSRYSVVERRQNRNVQRHWAVNFLLLTTPGGRPSAHRFLVVTTRPSGPSPRSCIAALLFLLACFRSARTYCLSLCVVPGRRRMDSGVDDSRADRVSRSWSPAVRASTDILVNGDEITTHDQLRSDHK